MKNIIIIDVDTDRKDQILFGKTPEFPDPTNREEAKEMIITDISHVSGALCTLIDIADYNQYASKELLINSVKEQLDQLLIQKAPENNESVE